MEINRPSLTSRVNSWREVRGLENNYPGLKRKLCAQTPPHDPDAAFLGLTLQAVCHSGTGAVPVCSICSTPVFLILTLDQMW